MRCMTLLIGSSENLFMYCSRPVFYNFTVNPNPKFKSQEVISDVMSDDV